MTVIADPALVLVDLQRDFCSPDGNHGRRKDVSPLEPAIEANAKFLQRYRSSGRSPILVRTLHDDPTTSPLWDDKYEGQDRERPCQPGTKGAEFIPEIGVRPSDAIVTKVRYSGFYETGLDVVLRSNEISQLLIGGVSTNTCVASTVRGGYDRDYDVKILEDCCGSTNPSTAEVTLRNLDGTFGEVVHSDTIELPSLADAG